mmetsp:Transcript_27569/g.47581  ORF Transcript_27569/g.47581 Transcript_27569/m.47581 type:complete len:237 (+) Transcript_27569:31-741(+)
MRRPFHLTAVPSRVSARLHSQRPIALPPSLQVEPLAEAEFDSPSISPVAVANVDPKKLSPNHFDPIYLELPFEVPDPERERYDPDNEQEANRRNQWAIYSSVNNPVAYCDNARLRFDFPINFRFLICDLCFDICLRGFMPKSVTQPIVFTKYIRDTGTLHMALKEVFVFQLRDFYQRVYNFSIPEPVNQANIVFWWQCQSSCLKEPLQLVQRSWKPASGPLLLVPVPFPRPFFRLV